MRSHPGKRAFGLTAGLAAIASAAALSVLVDADTAPKSNAAILLRGGDGALGISNSAKGRAILTGSDMRPGDVVRGRVRVTNGSSARARLFLSKRIRDGSLGPNGGRLASQLTLRVRRTRKPTRRPRTEYWGSLARMPATDLGRWRSGSTRRYRFRVKFPDGGVPLSPVGGDNAYQGASTKVRFVWRAKR